MNNIVYNFKLDIGWKLINLISEIDRFDANWTAIERKEGQSLKELKSIATVRSVGASNRIEGNRMSDEEVDVLLQEIDIIRLWTQFFCLLCFQANLLLIFDSIYERFYSLFTSYSCFLVLFLLFFGVVASVSLL